MAQAAGKEEAARKAAIKAGAAPPPASAEAKGEGGDAKKKGEEEVVVKPAAAAPTACDVLYVESDAAAAELCEQGLEALRKAMVAILDDDNAGPSSSCP